MTRDEAIERFRCAGRPNSLRASDWIEKFVALEMLKLDEPKSAHELTYRALVSGGHPVFEASRVIETLDRAGLKVVEK